MIDYLVEAISKYPVWNHMSAHDPEEHHQAHRFYMFAVAQQCGTGAEPMSCRKIWDVYIKNWRTDAGELFFPTSFERFKELLSPVIVEHQLAERFNFHNEILTTLSMGKSVNYALDHLVNTKAYGRDPLRKKINLLSMILKNRPEKFVAMELGPVVDYHVMRAIGRYFGHVTVGYPGMDERLQRQTAYFICNELVLRFPLTHSKVDGYLWELGREICTYDKPDCAGCPVASHCKSAFQMEENLYKEPRIKTYFY